MYNPYASPASPAGINWVQGSAGAKAYMVAPGATCVLFDSEEQLIYLKSADQSGMPTMKVLEYTIREGGGGGDYVTRSEMAAVMKELHELKDKIAGGAENE